MNPKIRALYLDPVILGFTILMATVSVVLSLVDKTGKSQHKCARFWARGILALSGVTVRVKGLEHLDPEHTYVLASNHQSFFDIWTLLASLPLEFRFVAKESLFKWPFVGWHLRRAGHIAIDRGKTKRGLQALLGAVEKLKSGTSILVFPEGTRSLDGAIGPFKKGSMLIALKSGVPVVPITISGSRHCLPKNSAVPRPGVIDMVIGTPIDASQYFPNDLKRLTEDVRAAVVSNYIPSN
jgi:1-acyl-sn-glycerol-3-phosphate acyltransferase